MARLESWSDFSLDPVVLEFIIKDQLNDDAIHVVFIKNLFVTIQKVFPTLRKECDMGLAESAVYIVLQELIALHDAQNVHVLLEVELDLGQNFGLLLVAVEDQVGEGFKVILLEEVLVSGIAQADLVRLELATFQVEIGGYVYVSIGGDELDLAGRLVEFKWRELAVLFLKFGAQAVLKPHAF